MDEVGPNQTETETTEAAEKTIRDAFIELEETLDFHKLQTLQLDDGTIVSEECGPFEALESFIQSFPRIQIEGMCDGPSEFRMGRTIGAGGMGIVREAQQLSIDRPVAMKMPRPGAVQRADVINLLREAWLTGALEHPNIVPVYVLGRDARDLPVFVMKRIKGVSWKRLLEEPNHPLVRQTGQDPLARHLEIFMRVCEAVRFAHSRGIIHRDIKPGNVMIGSFGEVYLLDWGIAVSTQDDAAGRFPLARDVRSIAGTPEYMPPEMVEPSRSGVDQRTDIYLLGSVLYEILSGHPPHRADTLKEALRKAYSSEAPEVSEGVPDELGHICKKAISKVPDDRYQSVEELRQAVAEFLTHRASLQLTDQALMKLSELRDLLEPSEGADEEALKHRIYRAFGESRFGFAQSLEIWNGNQNARAGLNEVLGRMVEYEVSRKNPDAADALLAEMPEKDPGLDQQVAALKDALNLERKEIEDLRKIREDTDLGVAFGTRGRVAITFAIFFPLIEFVFGHLERTGALTSLYLGCITSLLVFMAACNTFIFGWMRSLLENAVNRRVIISMNIAFVSGIIIMLFGSMTGTRFNVAVSVEMTAFAVICAMLGLFVERRIFIGTAIYLVLSIGPAVFESYTHEFIGVANMMVFGTFAWIWWPFRRGVAASGSPRSDGSTGGSPSAG